MRIVHVARSPIFVLCIGIAYLCGLAEPSRGAALRACDSAGATQTWNTQEHWIWNQLCAGERADLATFAGSHVVRSQFVVQILNDHEFEDVLPRTGVAIAHARFIGPLLLAHHAITIPLSLEYSQFDSTLDLSRFASSTNLSLQGSKGGFVDLRYLRAGDLWLREVSFSQVDLSSASIGGWVFADKADVRGTLDFTGATVENSLNLDGSRIGKLYLTEAQLGSQLFIRHAVVTDSVDMREATIGRQAEFDDSAFPAFPKDNTLIDLRVAAHLRLPKTAGDIDLSGSQIDGDLLALGSQIHKLQLARAHVGGQVSIASATIVDVQASGLTLAKDWSMVRSRVTKYVLLLNDQVGGSVIFDRDMLGSNSLNLSHIAITGNLNLFNDTVDGRTRLSNVHVEGDVQLSGDTMGVVDATGSKIGGDLLLAQYAPIHWHQNSFLILHNVGVRAIEDRNKKCLSDENGAACDPWPPAIDLSGLTYEQLGSASAAIATSSSDVQFSNDPIERPEIWWKNHWFAKQKPFSPAPYDELSSVLRKFGNDEVADQIMYDRHNDEATTQPVLKNPMLVIQRDVIGYGYDVWRAFPWAFGFVFLGVVVLKITGEGKRLGLPFGVTYSFDMLLPLVRLREANYKLEPQGFTQYYFYFHKIAGFVLATFLVAALSGLTKQ